MNNKYKKNNKRKKNYLLTISLLIGVILIMIFVQFKIEPKITGQYSMLNGYCTPDCEGKECGDDGCGGSCGSCGSEETCENGQCVCDPDCAGKECGPDGCGGSCGSCSSGESCVNGQCIEGPPPPEPPTPSPTPPTGKPKPKEPEITINIETEKPEYYFEEIEEISEINCTDSDGGEDYYIKGACTDFRGNYTDYCDEEKGGIKKDNLEEVSCKFVPVGRGSPDIEGKTICAYSEYTCPLGCKEGACIEEETITGIGECEETDGGKDYYQKGITSRNFMDYCQDENQLAEYYCSDQGEYIQKTYYNCLNGCHEGACNMNCFGDVYTEDIPLAYFYNLSDPVIEETAIKALQEYANYKDVPLSSLDTPDDYMEAVAYYVDKHMNYLFDEESGLEWYDWLGYWLGYDIDTDPLLQVFQDFGNK